MERIPFKKEELEQKGVSQAIRRFMPFPILNTPITPKENFKRYVKGEGALWIPSSGEVLNMTPAIMKDNIARGFVFDGTEFDPGKEGGGPDMFGVEWEWVPAVGGSMVRPGNPKVKDINEWEKYITFPNPEEWDWEGSAKLNEKLINDPVRMIGVTFLNGLFERLISFVEMNEAMVAMIDEDEQEAVHRLFDKLADFYCVLIEKFKKYYKIDLLTFHDDWGSQRAPFFSLDTVREMLVPYLKRITDKAHSLDIIFELHSCGKNEMLVPGMIEAGVDMWNGQPMNDKKMLAEKYGDKMLFCVPAPGLTNESTDADIEAAYDKLFEEFKGLRWMGARSFMVNDSYECYYKHARIALCGEE